MNCSENEVTCFSRMDRRQKRLFVTHFAHKDDIRIFSNRMLHRDAEIQDVVADFSLVDQTLLFLENKLNRIFECQDVLAIVSIHIVQHGGNGRTFTRAGHSRKQHHSLIVVAQTFDDRRQIEPFEIGDEVVDAASDQADPAKLLEHVDAKPPVNAVDLDHMSEVTAPFFLENFSSSVIHHREEEFNHFFNLDGRPV